MNPGWLPATLNSFKFDSPAAQLLRLRLRNDRVYASIVSERCECVGVSVRFDYSNRFEVTRRAPEPLELHTTNQILVRAVPRSQLSTYKNHIPTDSSTGGQPLVTGHGSAF